MKHLMRKMAYKGEKMGSVKDLTVLKKPEEHNFGIGDFTYSDRFSVFDWGEMPDLIEHKGEAIALLGGYFFELLEKEGLFSHYAGIVENSVPLKTDRLTSVSNVMRVNLVNIYKPGLQAAQYDYSLYSGKNDTFLIPLEVIYRNELPEGSSVFKRISRRETDFKKLGLAHPPIPGEKLGSPVIECSTKLEITDRYIDWEEAKQMACLTSAEIENIKRITNFINSLISKEYKKLGIENLDGKIELAFNEKREIMLVDVFGTLDECRFMKDGLQISKEVARIFYRKTKWYEAIEEAKIIDRQNWKEKCTEKPQPLPEDLKKAISDMYCSITNQITGKNFFPNVPDFKEIESVIKKYY